MASPDRRPILLLEHDPVWASAAASEAEAIMAACRPWVERIEHIGSTAVPGLIAKPVLDLMPGLVRVDDGLHCIAPMRRLGYAYRGEYGIPGRHFFIKGETPAPRTHNIHMFVIGSTDWERHLRFRDALRTDPAAAAEYATLKRELAARAIDDMHMYTEGKADFCMRLGG